MNEIIKQLLDYQHQIEKELEDENTTNIEIRAIEEGNDSSAVC
uniref:Uncharacterized protein n=1 Tax=Dulem virus 30 TaxID=3145748 RepID=A0AAU8B625_9CAUD